MNLNDAFVWIMSGGGAAYVGFWLVERVAFLAALTADVKRYAAFILTGALAVGAWCGLTALTGEPWPVDWQAWVNVLFGVAATAIIAGQAVHGVKVLRQG